MTEAMYQQFGARLAAERRRAGLTQAELARTVGLSRASIANIEGGKQRVFLDQVVALASAVGLSDLASLVPYLSEGSLEHKRSMMITGSSRLSRKQELLLADILDSLQESGDQ